MHQLHPRAVWFFFLRAFYFAPLLAVIISIRIIISDPGPSQTVSLSSLVWSVLLYTLIFAIPLYIWSKLTYHYYKYELRPDGFRKEHGIIWKKYVTIPYDRIQNVDIYRGLIARLLGLSDLQIQTAGGISTGSYGAFSEGRLPGLSREVAEQLRDEVIKKRPHSTHSNQGL